eukprot:CAMPEP_0172646988 /NCGR_PEP_ID=MMETSP1068-20121228/240523_1 /TAXON_ID=35684 /ORGANISM="Pseudopedinella elastica, Strain CCMP716" /LENGTH=263 /DNA_ID=CAMNT_0013461261 /DNA_START=608 /DNA_END=1399 /DNA_ORIENTATION=+
MNAVSFNRTELRRYLIGALDGVDAAVVSFGLWYDWEGAAAKIGPPQGALETDKANEVSADAAEKLVHKCSFSQEDLSAFDQVVYGPVWFGSFPSRARRVAVRRRYRCADLMLGPTSYASDLRRFIEVVRDENLPSGQGRLPTWMVWKDLPPQHFLDRASGRWETAGSEKIRDTKCGPVKDEALAYERNAIADSVIGGSPGVFSAVARTWNEDLPRWDLHAKYLPGRAVDCTHFCNPSPVTWTWCASVVRALAAAMIARPKQPV